MTPFPSLSKAIERTDREFLLAAKSADKSTSATLRWGESMLEEVNLSERIATGQKQKFSRKECWLSVEVRLRELALKNSLPQPATLADVKLVCECRHNHLKNDWTAIAYAVLIPCSRIVNRLSDGKKVVHKQNGVSEDRSGTDQIAIVLDDARVMTVQGFRKTWSIPSSTDASKALVNAIDKLAANKCAVFKAYCKVIATRSDSAVFLKILQDAIKPAPRRAKTPKTVEADTPVEIVFDGENRLTELLQPSIQ